MRPPGLRCGHRALDESGQLFGRLDRRMDTGFHDVARDAAGERLLAVLAEERRQFPGIEGGQEIGRGNADRRVETHVEPTAGPEPETALGVGQLETRQTEVEQHPVDLAEARRRRDFHQLAEVGLPQDRPVAEACQPVRASGDGRPVGVYSEEAAIRS